MRCADSNDCADALRLPDFDELVALDGTGDSLRGTRGPQYFDALDSVGRSESEVERQEALRKIAGLAVVYSGVGLGTSVDADYRAEAIAIGAGAHEAELEKVEVRFLVAQIAD